MVRACRQPLTSSQDEIDDFAFVMLAVELEKKKIAERDALKTTEVNSANTTKAPITPEPQSHHEGLQPNPPKPKTLP